MTMGGTVKPRDPKDNVVPIRPAQPSLFADALPANDTEPRVNPRRALVKFRVRPDYEDDDIPLEEPVQHGLFDADVDRDAFAATVVNGQAISDREFLRRDTGSDASGHARAEFRKERNAIVAAFFNRVKRAEGYEAAVCALFSMLADDPSYMADSPPQWILKLFVEERKLLIETFCTNSKAWVFPASSADDDEAEEG